SEQLRQAIDKIDDPYIAARDYFVLLLCELACATNWETARLHTGDVTIFAEGLEVILRREHGEMRTVRLPRSLQARYCPVRHWERLCALLPKPGFAILNSKTYDSLSNIGVNHIIKARMRSIGVITRGVRLGPSAIRRGFVVEGIRRGESIDKLARHVGLTTESIDGVREADKRGIVLSTPYGHEPVRKRVRHKKDAVRRRAPSDRVERRAAPD
ncbi:MAG: hypothetical protein WB491_09775, partial [Candidatus Aquilonibacter sp.]